MPLEGPLHDRRKPQERLALHEARDTSDEVLQGGGVIVNTSSILGLVGLRNGTGKHGVVGLTKTAALEYADDRIRVNAVCPGFIRTPMTAETQKERADQITSRTPLGRFGEPQDIAEMVVWLCSDRASYVTGAAYAVDGGWTAI